MRKDILQKENDIKQWIEENKSKAFICKQLRCKPDTLERYLKILNIEYKGNKGSKGVPRLTLRTPIENYLQKDGTFITSHHLKIKLIDYGIKKHQCELCGLETWLNQPIPIELHHIDGNHDNNELDNLQILCPNCHALQPNNSGAANKK